MLLQIGYLPLGFASRLSYILSEIARGVFYWCFAGAHNLYMSVGNIDSEAVWASLLPLEDRKNARRIGQSHFDYLFWGQGSLINTASVEY